MIEGVSLTTAILKMKQSIQDSAQASSTRLPPSPNTCNRHICHRSVRIVRIMTVWVVDRLSLAAVSATAPGPGKMLGSAVTILPILPHWQLASDSGDKDPTTQQPSAHPLHSTSFSFLALSNARRH